MSFSSIDQWLPALFLGVYNPVGFHSNPNKGHDIQQLEMLLSC
uniref:Uncharacterized protein n=1 Tax=Anguilla anguilla TaxID=7936 RepID=A0A0E9VE46_ANGAN